jgi:hypothetical protein
MGTEDTSLLSNGSRKVLVSRSIRCFCLLLIHNRLNTWATLQRKNFFVEDYTCIMCNWGTLEVGNKYPSVLSVPFRHHMLAIFVPSLDSPTSVHINVQGRFLTVWRLRLASLSSWN